MSSKKLGMKKSKDLNLKVALAQIKTQPGQLELNKNKIIATIKAARKAGAELVVFSELALCGYGSLDLFLNQKYLDQSRAFLKEIQTHTEGITAVVGFADYNSEQLRSGQRLQVYNSAAVLCDCQLQLIQNKSLLPTYSIFQEERYFVPAASQKLFEIAGVKVGLEICEDLWSEGYLKDPTSELINQGAQLIINISASPFEIGKFSARQRRLFSAAKQADAPFIYVNLVGSYDGYEGELVFDGRSLVVSADGQCLAQAQAFNEDLLIVDLADSAETNKLSALSEIEEVSQALHLALNDYFLRLDQCTSLSQAPAIIGISGGIDSAVVAAIAVAVLGADRVVGVNIPTRFNSQAGISDSHKLCQNLGIRFETIPIDSICNDYQKLFLNSAVASQLKTNSLAFENLQARQRMVVLMYFANLLNAVVLCTGNKTELALDNCTIYGDLIGAINILGDLDKDRVYQLAEYLNRSAGRDLIPQSIIDRVPTAELKADQVDADVMGAEPAVIAPLVRAIVEAQLSRAEIEEKYSSQFSVALIQSVYTKLARSEWKRRQAPPAVRVTSTAFGLGRRIPVLHKFIG
jgi:NAD+ synthase (glutamine-hydrolysing)